MSDPKELKTMQIAPGLAVVFDPDQWALENGLVISGLSDDVRVQIDLRIQDILAETSQRVEGVTILRSA